LAWNTLIIKPVPRLTDYLHLTETTIIEGITFIKYITHNKHLVQIEIDDIGKLEENWEDILDVITATLRKADDKISLKDLESELKKEDTL
jgi:hypothetical protein